MSPKFRIDQQVYSKGGAGPGRVVERQLRRGADLKGSVRIAGLPGKLAEDWEYMIVGPGFNINRWYDQDSLVG